MDGSASSDSLDAPAAAPVKRVASPPGSAARTLQVPCMSNTSDTWLPVLVVDPTDKSVLAEGVVGFTKRRKRWQVSDPPVVMQVVQGGEPGYVVVQDLKGAELVRLPYELPKRARGRLLVAIGDTIRLQHLSFEVKQ